MRQTEPAGISNADLAEITRRLDRGCPTRGVTLSPWATQLLRDARSLLGEVQRVRGEGTGAKA